MVRLDMDPGDLFYRHGHRPLVSIGDSGQRTGVALHTRNVPAKHGGWVLPLGGGVGNGGVRRGSQKADGTANPGRSLYPGGCLSPTGEPGTAGCHFPPGE